MVLTWTIPEGVVARYATLQRVLGWMGLACLTFVWVRTTTAVALRVHSLISDYEGAYGDVHDQWYGRQPQPAEFAQLKLSLEAISGFRAGVTWGGLFSLLAWFTLWIGCSRWALKDQPVAWRPAVLLASAIPVAQTIMLWDAVQAYIAITD